MVKLVLLGVRKLRTCCDSVEGSVRLAKGSLPVQCLDGLGASMVMAPASDTGGRDRQGRWLGATGAPVTQPPPAGVTQSCPCRDAPAELPAVL